MQTRRSGHRSRRRWEDGTAALVAGGDGLDDQPADRAVPAAGCAGRGAVGRAVVPGPVGVVDLEGFQRPVAALLAAVHAAQLALQPGQPVPDPHAHALPGCMSTVPETAVPTQTP